MATKISIGRLVSYNEDVRKLEAYMTAHMADLRTVAEDRIAQDAPSADAARKALAAARDAVNAAFSIGKLFRELMATEITIKA